MENGARETRPSAARAEPPLRWWETFLLKAWSPFGDTRAGAMAASAFFSLRAVLRGFRGERISLRAGALVYLTLFSLVPLTSLAFGLLHQLDGGRMEAEVRQLVFSLLAPGVREEGAAFLFRFLETAGNRTVGLVGFVLLLVSSASLLRQVDASLNELWNVPSGRPLWISAAVYLLVLLVGPVLAALSIASTGVVRGFILELSDVLGPTTRLLISLGRLGIPIALLSLLYKLAPNAPVRWRSALVGGGMAGLAWEAARLGYDAFALRIIRYDPVYGMLGAAPLFLAWLWLSWFAVLAGARLAYAVELSSQRALGVSLHLQHHPRARALVAARIAQVATAAYLSGDTPPRPEELAHGLRVPIRLVLEVVRRLERAGLVTLGWRGCVQPAKAPGELTLEDVLVAIGAFGLERAEAGIEEPLDPLFARLEAHFQRADEASAEHLRRLSWLDLAGLGDPLLETSSATPIAGESVTLLP